MRTLNRLFLVLLISTTFILESVENSIVPTIEQYESIEHLENWKYSDTQFSEITTALGHKQDKLRVVTYNVLFDGYANGSLAEENRWSNRLPRILELLDEMQADIIGVQEFCIDQYNDMFPQLENVYGFVAREDKEEELNGIFYKKSRFELIDSKVWFLTTTPEVPSRNAVTMVQLKDTKTGQSVAVFNAHFDFSEINTREFEARFICQKIIAVQQQMPCIFMGDLNTFSNRPDLTKLPFYDGDYIQRIFAKAGLKDAKEISLLGHVGPIATFTNSGESPVSFKGTGTPGIFLDHIYVSEGIDVLIHAVQCGTVDGHFPSDHQPVLMDFFLE